MITNDNDNNDNNKIIIITATLSITDQYNNKTNTITHLYYIYC